MILTLQDISKSYRQTKALQSFSYRFEPGVYALLGPNGAGKSTLMNILVQNLQPDCGQILADDCDVSRDGAVYRARIGFVPQQQALPKYYSVEHFLYYIAALKGLSNTTAAKQIQEVLQLTNLSEKRNAKLGALSGGMKQRILIAQAVLGNPELLIMDEPTAGLDPKERIRIRNLISSVSAGRIVLIATHVVSDIECIADKILFLRKGELIDHIFPRDLESRLQGKVFEWKTSENDAVHLLHDFRVSALIQESDGLRVRMVTENAVPENAVPVTPHLEDMYLYLFGKDA